MYFFQIKVKSDILHTEDVRLMFIAGGTYF